MIAVEETKQTSLLCLTYDTFYHAATAWSGGQDAEGVPGEIPGIRALPRAPHVSDTTSLPFQRADPFGEENIILFLLFVCDDSHTFWDRACLLFMKIMVNNQAPYFLC